ncbi:MAG: hypothetical protein OSJ58_05670 [Dysosmobacter sp.]|nr:hypothetical protein [Dysosmobacter sp.]
MAFPEGPGVLPHRQGGRAALAEFHGLTRTFHPHILTIKHML